MFLNKSIYISWLYYLLFTCLTACYLQVSGGREVDRQVPGHLVLPRAPLSLHCHYAVQGAARVHVRDGDLRPHEDIPVRGDARPLHRVRHQNVSRQMSGQYRVNTNPRAGMLISNSFVLGMF